MGTNQNYVAHDLKIMLKPKSNQSLEKERRTDESRHFAGISDRRLPAGIELFLVFIEKL
jgi:hypothetical protein